MVLLRASQNFPPGKKKNKKTTSLFKWPELTGCRGPLISMLFLPSVNFDYGAKPVMAPLSFLSVSCSLWLLGVGGAEELIGNCRAHCLQIHGFLDWPASSTEARQLLQTHNHRCARDMYPFLSPRSSAKPISTFQVAVVGVEDEHDSCRAPRTLAEVTTWTFTPMCSIFQHIFDTAYRPKYIQYVPHKCLQIDVLHTHI